MSSISVTKHKKFDRFRLVDFFIQAAVGVPRSELAELWGFP